MTKPLITPGEIAREIAKIGQLWPEVLRGYKALYEDTLSSDVAGAGQTRVPAYQSDPTSAVALNRHKEHQRWKVRKAAGEIKRSRRALEEALETIGLASGTAHVLQAPYMNGNSDPDYEMSADELEELLEVKRKREVAGEA